MIHTVMNSAIVGQKNRGPTKPAMHGTMHMSHTVFISGLAIILVFNAGGPT
jgi:hypothetical protein